MEHTNNKVFIFQKENEILMDMVRDLRIEVKELKMTKEEKGEDFAKIRADLEVKLNVNAFGNLIKMRFSTITKENNDKEETVESESTTKVLGGRNDEVREEAKREDDDEKLLAKYNNSSGNHLDTSKELVELGDFDVLYNSQIIDQEEIEELEVKDTSQVEEIEESEKEESERENGEGSEKEKTRYNKEWENELVTISNSLIGSKIYTSKEQSTSVQLKTEIKVDAEEKAIDDGKGDGGSSVEDLCNEYRGVIRKYSTHESSNLERTNNHSYDSKLDFFENFDNLLSELRSTAEPDKGCREEPTESSGEKAVSGKRGDRGEPCEGELLWSSLGRQVEEDPIDSGGEEPTKKRPRKKLAMCGRCSACIRTDCDNCRNCLDKPRNGGDNTRKQKCLLRKCNPDLEQAQKSARVHFLPQKFAKHAEIKQYLNSIIS